MRSSNEVCAGKYLNTEYIPLPCDADNLERLTGNVEKLKQKIDCE